MAAIVTFPNGTTATLQDGKWSCADALLLDVLESSTEQMLKGGFPEPERGTAYAIAEALHGEVTHCDPAPKNDLPAGTIY